MPYLLPEEEDQASLLGYRPNTPGISPLDLFSQILSQPLAAQIPQNQSISDVPPVADKASEYKKLLGGQGNMGMLSSPQYKELLKQYEQYAPRSPEEQYQVLDEMKPSAFWAGYDPQGTAPMMKLQDQQAKLRMDPYASQREHLGGIFDRFIKLKSAEKQESEKDYLNQQRKASTEKTSYDNYLKQAFNDPTSKESLESQPNTASEINGYMGMLNSFGKQGAKGEVPGLVSTATSLEEILGSVPGMSYNQQQKALDRAKQLMQSATGLRNTEIDRLQVSVSGQRANTDEDYKRIMAEIAKGKLGLANKKFELKTTDAKIPTKDMQAIQEPLTYVNQLDRLQKDIDAIETGLIAKGEMKWRDFWSSPQPEVQRVRTLATALLQPSRVKITGVSYSPTEQEFSKNILVDIRDNPETLKAKLDELMHMQNDKLAGNLSAVLGGNRVNYEGDIGPSNARDVASHVLKSLRKSGENIKIPLMDESASPQKPLTAPLKSGKKIVDKLQNKTLNKTKYIYDDGTEETVDGLK